MSFNIIKSNKINYWSQVNISLMSISVRVKIHLNKLPESVES